MPFNPPCRPARSERGYILLTLMLIVALMAIAAAAIAPTLAFQVRRDREEELIHRGVQYSRAVRRYFKKFGRYPTRIEDLESSNNLRFLRKRYKDPITNQDFKLLHFGEVQMAMGGSVIGGSTLGTPIGNGPAGTATQSSQFSLGGNSGGQQNPATNQGQSQGAASSDSDASANAQSGSSASPTSQTGPGGGQTFGGGPIIGVISTSKAESIREFNNKNHYNQWQFIYDPSTDRGGLLNTPNQPPLQNAVAMQPGATGTTGAPGAFGTQTPSTGSGTAPFGQQTPAPMQNQPQPQPQTPAQP